MVLDCGAEVDACDVFLETTVGEDTDAMVGCPLLLVSSSSEEANAWNRVSTCAPTTSNPNIKANDFENVLTTRPAHSPAFH